MGRFQLVFHVLVRDWIHLRIRDRESEEPQTDTLLVWSLTKEGTLMAESFSAILEREAKQRPKVHAKALEFDSRLRAANIPLKPRAEENEPDPEIKEAWKQLLLALMNALRTLLGMLLGCFGIPVPVNPNPVQAKNFAAQVDAAAHRVATAQGKKWDRRRARARKQLDPIAKSNGWTEDQHDEAVSIFLDMSQKATPGDFKACLNEGSCQHPDFDDEFDDDADE